MFSSIIFNLMFFTLVVFVTAQEKRCNIAIRCSTVKEPVLATDGENCEIFRNSCFMISENCNRVNNNQTEFVVVPKDDCENMCYSSCTQFYMPVCGTYNDTNRTFSNECMMNVHRCSTNETYELLRYDSCESDLY